MTNNHDFSQVDPLPHTPIPFDLVLRMCIEDGVQLRHYPNGVWRGRCPFHEDRNPSFEVAPGRSGYYYFLCRSTACGVSGGIRKYVHLSGRGDTDYQPPPPVARLQRPPTPTLDLDIDPRVISLAVRHYQIQLSRSPEALTYLKGRGLTGWSIRANGLGYAPGDTLQNAMEDQGIPYEALRRNGLVNPNPKRRRDHFRQRIILPHRDGPDQPWSWLNGRAIRDDTIPKYLYMPGPRPPLINPARGREPLFIVEGAFDQMVLEAIGFAATATGGAPTSLIFPDALLQAIQQTQSNTIIILPDRDKAGEAWAAQLIEATQAAGIPNIKLAQLPAPHEDPAQLGRAQDPHGLVESMITEATDIIDRPPQHPATTTTSVTPERQQEFISMSKAVASIVGNLGHDPRHQVSTEGHDMTKFSIGVTKRDKTTNWYNVTFFGRQGEIIRQYFKKGDPIFVSGELEASLYQGRDSGETMLALNLTGQSFSFVASRNENSDHQHASSQASPPAVSGSPATNAAPSANPPSNYDYDDLPFDELPF